MCSPIGCGWLNVSFLPTPAQSVSPSTFWVTQPVVQSCEECVEKNSQIKDLDTENELARLAEQLLKKTSPNPLTITPSTSSLSISSVGQTSSEQTSDSEGFLWSDCDIQQVEVLDEIYHFLGKHYVRNDSFSFLYSKRFLNWALTPPGYKREWHVCLREPKFQSLIGFISAVPVSLRINGRILNAVFIDFFCLHSFYRKRGFGPRLIREVIQRVLRHGTQRQAIYTAGVTLTPPIAVCNYYHTALNPEKLIEVGFSGLGGKSLKEFIKIHELPESPTSRGFRQLEERDIPQSCKLLNDYMKQFKLARIIGEEEFRHLFLPRHNVIQSFVVEHPKTREIIKFGSYYLVTHNVSNHAKFTSIKCAYLFYYASSAERGLSSLILDLMICATQQQVDAFNILNCMSITQQDLEVLGFRKGTGSLRYYLYNWRCETLNPSDIGFVVV